ncbi:hypothetical protein [Bacteroides sp.]|uniref:hypothetical protein n=1 Tax=Bacteroides sp. TaxID=29523 RepID=UPI0023D49022|nr:hypothetical protein [Bacteroides sp.]MDE6216695.1 hypothetical protein [Bacteroides sp.]
MDYTMPKYEKSILSPDKVHFFYYDVMRNLEDNSIFLYDWNHDIQAYLDNKNIVIEAKEKDVLPTTIEKDKLHFTIREQDENNKAVAFFNHLRNAFAHLRIVPEGEYLNITDGSWKGKEKDKHFERTMIGQIKYEDLKELCFLFFKQRDKFIEENNI